MNESSPPTLPAGWTDISIPIRPDMPIFTGDPVFRIELAASIAAGDICNVSRFDFAAHTGGVPARALVRPRAVPADRAA